MISDEIVLISDPRVLAVPIIENNDELIDLRNYKELYLLKDEDEPSDISFSYARNSVALTLIEAQNRLPEGLRFLIISAHRSLAVQAEIFNDYSEKLKNLHSDWSLEEIHKAASEYVAPPDIIPPHSTGGAIDLTLVDEIGEELDMGTSIDTTPEESENACFTGATNISLEAIQNRAILIKVMTEAGFVNYPTEWWHWSYGDRYWAYIKKEPNALFGSVEDASDESFDNSDEEKQ